MKIDPAVVRALRERRAWSQEQLAEVAGVSVRTVQRVETGGGGSAETRMALASALEVAPVDLCRDAGGVPPPGDGGSGPSRDDDRDGSMLHRYQVVIVGLVIVFLLAFAIAYQVGKDLAARDSRAACEAAGRTDCR